MKKLNSTKIAFGLFATMAAACLFASVGSTLAWYAYSTRALVSYSGTSVSETASLQIGICSDVVLDDLPTSVSDVTFAGDTNHYYFAASGKGMTYDIITKYLSAKGYATDSLEPTTSGSFVTGSDQDSFSLKQAPNEIARGNSVAAYKREYLTIPFVFRIQGENPNEFYADKELWLTKAVAIAASSGNVQVQNAIRIFVDRDSNNYDTDFIVNPTADAKGKTRVGGVLNRTRDEYYDFDSNGEILYGEYDPAALDLISSDVYSGASVLDDVNGVGDVSEASTFVAKHYPNTKYYSNLSSEANDALFKHADYESISSIAPNRDDQGYLTNKDSLNPTSVCKTVEEDHYLGRVNMTVYLEGWDFSLVDKERAHAFDLGLTFEMSRL